MTNPDQTTDKYAELRSDTLDYLDKCADHFDGTPRLVKRLLAAVQDERESRLEAEAALDEMQGVVERLPRTKDGVRVIPMTDFVHSPHHNAQLTVWANGNAAPWNHNGNGIFRVSDCFSTREAALAERNLSGDSQGEGE